MKRGKRSPGRNENKAVSTYFFCLCFTYVWAIVSKGNERVMAE